VGLRVSHTLKSEGTFVTHLVTSAGGQNMIIMLRVYPRNNTLALYGLNLLTFMKQTNKRTLTKHASFYTDIHLHV